MMKWKRWIGILLLTAMLCSLMSCGLFAPKTDEESTDPTDTEATVESATSPDENAPAVFHKEDLKKFKIAYATDLGKEALAEVHKLADRIKSTYGVNMTVTSDFVMSGSEVLKEWEYEILIGCTNREESAEFQRNLREEDYGYGYKNGKILISGGNDQAVKNAIVLFALEVIVGHASEGVFYRSEWTKIEKKTYTIDDMKVNGVGINQYEIVYPNGSYSFEKEMAERLQTIVAEMTGFTLPIKSDIEAGSADVAFLIGRTKFSADVTLESVGANEGCVLGKGTRIIAYGDDLQGIVNASKLLTDLLFDETSNEKQREITVGEARKFDGADTFSVMTHNLQVGDVPAERIARAMKLIYKYMPDTLGVQEGKAIWMTSLKEKLGNYYGIVGEGREGGDKGEHTAILYAKAKYNLIDSGTKWLTDTPDEVSKLPESNYYRIFTWALLEDKATGTRYLHVNTHLDGNAVNLLQVKYLMQFLKGYNDVAVVLTGDMNATLSTNEMKYVQSFGFSTKVDYKELDHIPHYGRGSNIIDWIFVTSDSMKLTNYITDDNHIDGDYASDHNSYYAEFSVQYSTEGTLDHGWDEIHISFYPDNWLEVLPDEEGRDFGELIPVRK